MASPHEVLGVEPGADEETVERAYRRRAKETHPDGGGSVEAFRRVREAYERLQDGAGDAADERERRETPERSERGDRTDADGRTPGSVGAAGHEDGAGVERARVEYLNYAVLGDHGWTIDDDDLFERAREADLASADHGEFVADGDERLLAAAEAQGHAWPFACRGGACANCAVYVAEGSVETTVDHVLSEELHEAGFRLSCICVPASERLRVVYGVKRLPGLEEFRLPATRFERARGDD